MIPKLFLGFVKDILKRLGAEFFDLPETGKRNALKELDFDGSYLGEIQTTEDLLVLTQKALLALGKKKQLKKADNPLLLAFSCYLREKVIPLCDQIPTHFFITKANGKNEVLEKTFTDDSSFTALFKLYLKGATNEELNALFTDFFKASQPQTIVVTVQSARECGPELKSEIRNKYGENFFVVFRVNTRLLGGLLVYQNSKITDSSWLGKVTSLRQLTRNM